MVQTHFIKTGITIISQNKRSGMQNVEDNCTNTCSLPRWVNYLLLLTYVHVRCCKKKVIQYVLKDHLNTDMNGINNLKSRVVILVSQWSSGRQKKCSPSLTVTIFSLSVPFSVTISVTIAVPLPLSAPLPVIVIVTVSTTWFVPPTFFSWPTVVPLSGSLTSSKRNYFINFFLQNICHPHAGFVAYKPLLTSMNLIKNRYKGKICSLWCRYVFVYNIKDAWYKQWWPRTQLQVVKGSRFLM